MPKFEEICEVRAAGSSFKDWLSVEVRWAADDWRRYFTLQLAEPGKRGSISSIRLKPGDDVDILLAGQPALTGGKVVSRQTAYDAARHAVQVDGFSKAGNASRHSPEPEQYRNYTYTAIANKLLVPLGLNFKMDNPPDGADEKFKNVAIYNGESVADVLERLARQRGFFLTSDHDGSTIVGGLPKGTGNATLEEGVNILSANCHITDRTVAGTIEGIAQRQGSDDEYGSAVSQTSATGKITGVDPALTWRVAAEEPITEKELKTRVDMEIRKMLTDILVARITHRGWFRPGSQALWAAGDSATVKSPMLFWAGDGTLPLKVWEVSCRQDVQSGTTTTVTLVSPAAFEERYPDATAQSPLAQ
jgi:prophage tail gpP-like protein